MSEVFLQDLRTTVNKNLNESVEKLSKYISTPSISAQNKGIPEAVNQVVKFIEELNGEVKILEDLGGNPVIYGFFAAGKNGNSNKTLLFYNHYDVQPPEPLEEWKTEPFSLTNVDGTLFARGVADNKGDLIARLSAIKALQELEDGLPCNIKFLIEGEEEIGSPNLTPYLAKYTDLFQANACIWEFGGKDEQDRVSMVAGIKGMAYMDLICEGADFDLHSSVGAYVDNAAWRLVHALASMRNENNEIIVEGFHDGIIPPTEKELEIVRNLPFNEEALEKLYGLKRPLITKNKNQDPREAMVFDPTMTICGLESGYYGEGSKTVLPKKAMAKLDCRLVPGQDPNHIVECVRRHLDKHGFTDVKVSSLNGQFAYRSDFDDPFVDLVVQTAKDTYEREVVIAPNSAGTGPMYEFGNRLAVPVVSTGVGWVNSKAHSPNESIRLTDFEEGIVHMAYLMKKFG